MQQNCDRPPDAVGNHAYLFRHVCLRHVVLRRSGPKYGVRRADIAPGRRRGFSSSRMRLVRRPVGHRRRTLAGASSGSVPTRHFPLVRRIHAHTLVVPSRTVHTSARRAAYSAFIDPLVTFRALHGDAGQSFRRGDRRLRRLAASEATRHLADAGYAECLHEAACRRICPFRRGMER